ncbi:MAG: hypothetical protein AAGK28_16640, partial [Pseudomonadota bacterium]
MFAYYAINDQFDTPHICGEALLAGFNILITHSLRHILIKWGLLEWHWLKLGPVLILALSLMCACNFA